MRGDRNPSWKGGRTTHARGYVLVRSPEHPRAANGYVFEHILIAEQKLGRPIGREEIVHHINGVKDDNRPENLSVMSRADHAKLHHKATHCKRGHPLTGPEADVWVNKQGKPWCLRCRRELDRRRREKRRGGIAQKDRMHCPHGHPYDAENTGFTKRGHRYCRECSRIKARRYSHARKGMTS